MLCFSGFELYSRWVPLICLNQRSGVKRIPQHFGCSSRQFTRDFLWQDFSPARHLASGLTMFLCLSPSFSTQDHGFIKFSQSRHSVFDYATRPATSSLSTLIVLSFLLDSSITQGEQN